MKKSIKIITLLIITLLNLLLIGALTKSDIKNSKKVIEEYINIYDEIALKGGELELPDNLNEETKTYTQKKLYIIRKRMDNFNLIVDKCSNSYEYIKQEKIEDGFLIGLKLKKEYKYKNLKDSTFEIINYEFKLQKVNDQYFIIEINSDDIYDVAIKEINLSRSSKNNIDDFLKKEEELIRVEKENLIDIYEKQSIFNEHNNNINLEDSYRNSNLKELNRIKIKNYARKHYDNPSINYYDFTKIGGDCTNFVSQVMRAGGAPFDNVGNEKWYYYSSNNRTPSWTSVEFLYKYLMNNKGFGIQAEESNISKMKIGDIIQIDANFDGIYNHSLIVVENDFDEFKNNLKMNEGINDYSQLESLFEAYMLRSPFLLIAARTQNSYNRPLLTYPGEKRFIHLKGYNQ